ncbi:MAG: hypothetical protein P1P93_02415 [Gammaproteobacteria bacterium]|nr:hypothetical protein [Gammaproteobacteria bacterium]
MTGEENTEEITKLREIRWKTHLSQRVQDFAKVISDDDVFEKYFGQPYVEKLTSKSKDITKLVFKLGVIYTALMLSLFASHNVSESEFEVFGYGFKNLGSYKELLLFLAVSISPISAILLAYQKYINALVTECLKKLAPDESTRKFYSFTFTDDYFDGLISRNSGASTYWHGSVKLLTVVFGFTLLFLLITLIAGSFFIQISVIYDVATKPSLSQYVNLFVLVYAITSILFSWLISILQFPMPEVDLRNYSRLSELENNDPDKYKELMRKFSAESSKKEAISTIITSFVIYMSIFTAIVFYWHPSSLDDLTFILGKGMSGAFIVLFFSNELMGFIRKRVLAWFFRNYSEGVPNRLVMFGKVQKFLLFIRMIVPAVMSIGYAFYALRAIN